MYQFIETNIVQIVSILVIIQLLDLIKYMLNALNTYLQIKHNNKLKKLRENQPVKKSEFIKKSGFRQMMEKQKKEAEESKSRL